MSSDEDEMEEMPWHNAPALVVGTLVPLTVERVEAEFAVARWGFHGGKFSKVKCPGCGALFASGNESLLESRVAFQRRNLLGHATGIVRKYPQDRDHPAVSQSLSC